MIEPLEARIAPASAFVTYPDADGDLVKITASKPGPVAPPLDLADLSFAGGGVALTLDLTEAGFEGAKIVFTVTKKPGGDGLAHVGYINAFDRSLDQVIVKGDLGKIIVGDAATTDDIDLKLLSVRTLGALGIVTGAPDLASVVFGKLGALKVAGDFTDATLSANGDIGSVFIGGNLTGSSAFSGRIVNSDGIGSVRIVGSLIGGAGDDSGQISCTGILGPVQIGRDILGGAGDNSGRIDSGTSIGAVKIGGNIIGGAGHASGQVFSSGALGDVRIGSDIAGGAGVVSGTVFSFGAVGKVRVGGDLTGGAGNESGQISGLVAVGDVSIGGDVIGGVISSSGVVGGVLGEVRIGGDLIGGGESFSGLIFAYNAMGDVRVGGDVIGGSIAGSISKSQLGGISCVTGRIASVTIGGSLIAGSSTGSGSLERSGFILAGDDLGPVKIGGSIVGNSTNPALIIAIGQDVKPATGFDVAIASLAVKGDVRFAKILAGFNSAGSGVNADASIGPVTVGRNWVASNLVAGAQDAGTAGFGLGDTLQTVGDTALIARITSIAIKGGVAGSLMGGDHFGFVAQQIGSFKASGFIAPLTLAAANQNIALPFTIDVRILEV